MTGKKNNLSVCLTHTNMRTHTHNTRATHTHKTHAHTHTHAQDTHCHTHTRSTHTVTHTQEAHTHNPHKHKTHTYTVTHTYTLSHTHTPRPLHAKLFDIAILQLCTIPKAQPYAYRTLRPINPTGNDRQSVAFFVAGPQSTGP